MESLNVSGPALKDFVAGIDERLLLAGQLQIMRDHQPNQLLELHARLPVSFRHGLRWIAKQVIDFGGTIVAGILLYMSLPVKIERLRSCIQEITTE